MKRAWPHCVLVGWVVLLVGGALPAFAQDQDGGEVSLKLNDKEVDKVDLARVSAMLKSGEFRDKPSAVLENELWIALAALVEGRPNAIEGGSDFQQRVVDAMAGFEVSAATFGQLPTPKIPLNPGSPTQERVIPGRNCLGKVQHQVIEALISDPESLLPLATFFLDVYDLQSGPQRRFWLAGLNYEFASELAERYFNEAPDSRANTVTFWLAMADHLQSRGQYRAGQEALRLFGRVLELEPNHVTALRGQAFLAEKYGAFPKAVRSLERLVELSQTDAETRLRLGVNLLRVGRQQRGETALLEVARGEADDWIRIVAYEELGRLYVDHSAKAVRMIREGLAHFPDASSLRLLLAFHLRDAWRSAKSELERVEKSWRKAPALSPRGRYDVNRQGSFEVVHRRLNREAEKRFPTLEGALFRLAISWQRSRALGGRAEIVQCGTDLPGGTFQ